MRVTIRKSATLTESVNALNVADSHWRINRNFEIANSRKVNTAGFHEKTTAVYDLAVSVSFVVISKHSRV